VVPRWLELPTSLREGGGAMWLKGEANLPLRSRACFYASSESFLLIMAGLILKKQQHASEANLEQYFKIKF
jgi:hypothetical protein